MSTYIVQAKTPAGNWRALMFDARHKTKEEAIARACSLDPDGIFSPDARVIHAISEEIVCNFKIWKDDQINAEATKTNQLIG